MGTLAFLTALRSAGAKLAPLPTTLSALPGLEVGNVQRIPRRLKLALARLELRMVIFVSSWSASPCDTFIMSAKYFSAGYSLDTRLRAPPQKAVLPWGKLACDFSTMMTTSTIFFSFAMLLGSHDTAK